MEHITHNISTNEPKDDDILIRVADLKKIIPDCSKHVFGLIKTAKHLHFNSNFDKSIIFAVLAFEEFNKLVFFTEHQKNLKDITRKELSKMNDHKSKLQYYIEVERKRQVTLLEDMKDPNLKNQIKKANQMTENTKRSFLLLNFIKKLAMYYDFREGRTLTLTNQIRYDNLNHFSLLFLETLAFMINAEMLKYYYGDIIGNIVSPKEAYENTEYWKNILSYFERMDSPSFEGTKQKYHNTILELELLEEYMRKNNLFL